MQDGAERARIDQPLDLDHARFEAAFVAYAELHPRRIAGSHGPLGGST